MISKKIINIVLTFTSISYLFFCAMLFFGLNSRAYIDPSAITYLIQIFSGILVSIGTIVNVFGRKFMRKFKSDDNKYTEIESDDIKMW